MHYGRVYNGNSAFMYDTYDSISAILYSHYGMAFQINGSYETHQDYWSKFIRSANNNAHIMQSFELL
jgi:hypothetical protein